MAAFAPLLCRVSFPVFLSKTVDRLSAQLAGRLNFEYKDPTKNFDRSRVKGLVAKLVQVKDPTHSTALEVAAGGRLYQARKYERGSGGSVVVDLVIIVHGLPPCVICHTNTSIGWMSLDKVAPFLMIHTYKYICTSTVQQSRVGRL